MSSTALTIPARGLPEGFGNLAQYLGDYTYTAPSVIIQESGPFAQFVLAGVYLRLAAMLIWHGLAALPGHIDRAAHRRLAAVPRTHLLAASASGLVGWTAALCLFVLFIWR